MYKKERLWEERKNILPMNNEEKQNKEKIVDITNETRTQSKEKECDNTGKMWVKNCPKCNNPYYYSNKYVLAIAQHNNSICKWCRRHTEKTKNKVSGKGNGMYGVHRYDKLNPFYGKRHDEEARRKMRIAACKRVMDLQRSNNGRVNNVNKKEGIYFNKLETERCWNGIYFSKNKQQHLIEYLGYFVDYYEPNLNIVVEYDEPRHYRYGKLIEKDICRMENIKHHLKCQFYRYDEYNDVLREF